MLRRYACSRAALCDPWSVSQRSRTGSSSEFLQVSAITIPGWMIQYVSDPNAVEFQTGYDFRPKLDDLHGVFHRYRHIPQPGRPVVASRRDGLSVRAKGRDLDPT